MRLRLRFDFTLVVLVAALVVAIWYWRPFEPRYQGKRLSVWAKEVDLGGRAADELTSQERQKKHDEAVAAIRHVGTKALPYALELCRAKDSALKEKLMDLAKKQAVVEFHFSLPEDKHEESSKIFSALGPIAKPAIPSLIKLLQGKDLAAANAAISALTWIGSDAVFPLIRMLADRNSETRARAAITLGQIEPKAYAAVLALLQCLKDEDRGVRNYAAYSLGNIGGDASKVVPALLKCLEEETNQPPFGVLSALRRFGTNATLAVPALVKIIESNQLAISTDAWITLRKIDPETAKEFISERGRFIRTNTPQELPLQSKPLPQVMQTNSSSQVTNSVK